MKISARINTFNEEDNIGAALESAAFADELIVVDSFSTDRTVEIARQHSARVVSRAFASHGDQHNFADALCAFDWILVLDADERITPELRASIEALRRQGTALDAFRMPRLAFYLGRWIHHSGWYPDFQTRLYRRGAAVWAGEPPHEAPKVTGQVGTLHGNLLHFTRRDLREHVTVMNYYTDLASSARFRAGKSGSLWSLALAPPATFLRSFFLKQGFRDGWQGLVIAYLAAAYVLLKQAKLLEKHRAALSGNNQPPLGVYNGNRDGSG